MEIKVKKGERTNYIEVNLTKKEIEELLQGYYPSGYCRVEDVSYCISVGVENGGN